ncbi:MAG: ABC transporter ATP-binding protein [Clostridiales bacterium]|nr:ABC transporter ATP-binding protein [Clostridiales bacterium]
MRLIQVNGLTAAFRHPGGAFPVLRDVSFAIDRGETVCLVGESGCGKSLTALSMLRLFGRSGSSAGKPLLSGEILLDETDLLKLPEREMQAIRGRRIAMIYQEPMTSLNPVFTIGWQITEAVRLHQKQKAGEAKARALEMLRLVEIPDPEKRYHEYPHRLSGGMRQRAMIAMALCCQPDLLIADEPTTALDATIQAQILALIDKLKKSLGMAVLLITHDMGVVAEIADRVLVMYAGRIVEETTRISLLNNAFHPYTKGLLACIPGLGSRRKLLPAIEGVIPDADSYPPGCAFSPRCPVKQEACDKHVPLLTPTAYGKCACFVAGKSA